MYSTMLGRRNRIIVIASPHRRRERGVKNFRDVTAGDTVSCTELRSLLCHPVDEGTHTRKSLLPQAHAQRLKAGEIGCSLASVCWETLIGFPAKTASPWLLPRSSRSIDGLSSGLWGSFSCKERRNLVIDGGAHRRGHELIVVELVVTGIRDQFRDSLQVRVADGNLRRGHWRQSSAFLGIGLFVGLVGQEANEINRFRWSILANCETIATTQHVTRRARATGDGREGEETNVWAFFIGRRGDIARRRPLAHQLHGSLAVAHDSLSVSIGSAKEAILEGMQSNQLLEVLPSLNERRIGKRAALMAVRLVEGSLAAQTHGKVFPIESARPLIFFAKTQRRDVRRLELLDVADKVVPGCWRRCDASFGEQALVVPEANGAHVPRHTIIMIVIAVQIQARLTEARAPAILLEVRGDVFEQPSSSILLQHATAPTLEDIGRGASLHRRAQLGLERVVGNHGDVDLDVGVVLHVLVGEVLKGRQQWVSSADMPPVNNDLPIATRTIAAGGQHDHQDRQDGEKERIASHGQLCSLKGELQRCTIHVDGSQETTMGLASW